MMTYAIIVAAGKAVRFGGDIPKQFSVVCGRPLLAWTISRFEKASSIDRIVLVVSEEALVHTGQNIVDAFDYRKVEKVVVGGNTRRESVFNGLNALPSRTELVAIHDGARPLVRPNDINRVVEAAAREKAAILAVPATDTVKRVRDGVILDTIDRGALYFAQTPQAFHYDLILSAHREVGERLDVTDDSSLLEARGVSVRVIEPTSPNLKVTTLDDLRLVEAILGKESHD